MSNRFCLAIETTGPYLGLALHDLSKAGFPCRARFFEARPGRQSDQLFPTLNGLLKKSRVKKSDLALIAVDHGPGSFTGVRVGVAAARGLAQGLSLPIIGVGSLEALAWQAASTLSGPLTMAAHLPALAGEGYFAVFARTAAGRWNVRRAPVWTTGAVIERELSKLAKAGAHLAFVARRDEAPRFPAGLVLHSFPAPDPSAVAECALARVGGRPSAARFDVEKTVPVYLQPSWAERGKKASRA
jgi:tRNA threonylcarbamoyl adenosine modification protein YeaZ